MDAFEQRRRFRTIMNSRVTLVILAVILVVVSKSTWSLYGKNKDAALNRARLERESKEIESRRLFLEKELARLKSPEGIEEMFRQKYNIKKEGEEVVVIIDKNDTSISSSRTLFPSWFGVVVNQVRDFFR